MTMDTTVDSHHRVDARRRNRILMALAILCVLAYAPAIIATAQGCWPFVDDALGMMSVWRAFTREALWGGVLPLWNPRLFCGLPFMSNGQAAVLYPPNIVYWTLPMRPALVFDAIAHNIFLAFGAYALARALRLSRSAAFVAADALALSSAVAAHIYVGHMTWHAARAYIPWELWALLLYLKSGRRRYAIGLAILFGLQSTAGYPPMVLLGAGLCIGLLIAWVTTWVWRRLRHGSTAFVMPRGWIAASLLTIALTASLSAVNFLPLRETSRLSPHGAGLSYKAATLMSGNWHSLVRLAMPEFFGGSRGLQWSLDQNAHEEAAYIGLFTLVLAIGAPVFARRQRPGTDGSDLPRGSDLPAAVPWLWALLPVSALLAMGSNTPFYRWMYDHFALLHLTRVPVRWLEVWCLCTSLLAGFAFDGCIHRAPAATRVAVSQELVPRTQRAHLLLIIMWTIVALLLLLLIALVLTSPNSHLWMETAQWNAHLPLGATSISPALHLRYAEQLRSTAVQEAGLTFVLAFLMAFILMMWQRGTSLPHQRRMARCLVLVITLDVLLVFWRASTSVTPTKMRHNATWPQAFVRAYRKGERWDTGLSWSAINRGMARNIDIFNGYDALGSKRYFQFVQAVEGQKFWTDSYQVQNYSPLLRVAGLTHTISIIMEPTRGWKLPGLQGQIDNWKLWRHEGAWPRVYVTRRLFRAPEAEQLAQLTALAEKDFAASGRPAVVGSQDFPAIRYSPLTSSDKVHQWSSNLNVTTIEATATAPSVLVQNEALSPGWRVWVNGNPARLSPANFLFRAVAVPAGQSRVAVVYDNQTYRFGLFLSLCGIGALSVMAVTFIRRGCGVLRLQRRPQ